MNPFAGLETAAVKIMTYAAAVLFIWFLSFAALVISRGRAEAYETAPEPLEPYRPRREPPADLSAWEEESEIERSQR
jgi:hypothetical protein